MKPYLELLQDILDHGQRRGDRTGVGTRSVFGRQLRFDLAEGLPAVTTKKLHFKSIIHELLWFLRGESNVRALQDAGVSIWDEWANEDGELGPVYGVQWRSWPTSDGRGIDQFADVIERIKTDPESRRLVVNAWNVACLDEMALPPCHVMFQFYVADGRLSCQVYQRSADVFLGLPFNLVSYAMLIEMTASVTGLKPGELVHTLGDAHLYENHLDQARLQLTREPYERPRLELARQVERVEDFRPEDLAVIDYRSHPRILRPDRDLKPCVSPSSSPWIVRASSVAMADCPGTCPLISLISSG